VGVREPKVQSTAWTTATSNSTDTQREQIRKPPGDPDAAGKEEDQAIEWHACYLGFGRVSRNSIFLSQLAQSAASAFQAWCRRRALPTRVSPSGIEPIITKRQGFDGGGAGFAQAIAIDWDRISIGSIAIWARLFLWPYTLHVT
jgi:hypothetical protein